MLTCPNCFEESVFWAIRSDEGTYPGYACEHCGHFLTVGDIDKLATEFIEEYSD